MASSSEKLLLKQITDLTRQIEKEKRGFGRSQFQSKKFVKPWANKSSDTLYSSYVNGAQHWQKPALSNVPVRQPGISTTRPKPPPKPSELEQHSFQGIAPIIANVTTKPKQVFVNPNFVQQKVGNSVHVNPNFRSQSPVLRTAKASELLAGASSTSVTASIAPSFPVERVRSGFVLGSTSSGPSGSVLGSTSSGPSGSVLGSTSSGPSGSVLGSTSSGPSGSVLGSTSSGPSGPVLVPNGAVPGGPSVLSGSAAAVVAVRTRRRSRSLSLSSRYRLLTSRKLVRRLSKEARTPPAPAAVRRTTVHTRHKLVRVAGTPRSQVPAKKLVITRHKLVRVSSTPRSQALLNKQAANGAAGVTSWPATGAAPGGAARPGASSSRYRLVRPATAAAAAVAAPVPSQHRTWRRRHSSTSSPGSRLTSAGSLRLGSTRFVNIGGLLYKSSARKLQRATPKPAQKNKDASTAAAAAAAGGSPGWISVRGARFRVEAGGRSLRRMDLGLPAPPRLDIGGVTFRAAGDGTLTADSRQQASRSLISRAKSRSLAVLRGSMRLSRQPCRFFCRLGRCRRHERGQCPHVHDAALRPVCTRHLQEGGCQRPGCAYNHEPRPEKIPHCLHFITAECRREKCPYQHVNVDADAPLCTKFLAGFCARGQLCNDKHVYICPEFSEEGKCPRGTACPLAHRARRRRRLSVRARPAAAPKAPPRGRGRYYLGGKAGPSAITAPETESDGDGEGNGEGRQRPAMAEMPSFIAIGDSSGDEE